MAARGPREVRDKEECRQYQRQEGDRAVLCQIVRNRCRNPSEREPGISPLFELGDCGGDQDDRAQQFSDPEDDAQLLRISDMRKSLNRLRIARQLTVSSECRQCAHQAGTHPVDYFARYGAMPLR